MFYVIQKKNNPIEFWSGKEWTISDSEVHLYFTRPMSVPEGGKVIEAEMGMNYPSNEKILFRIKDLVSKVFENTSVELHETKHCDPSISISNRIEIFWSDDTRLPSLNLRGVTMQPGYTVGVIHYDPGVWRYPDGSGEPPSWDVEEVGTYSNLEFAVRKALELEAAMRLDDYLEYEADQLMAEEMGNDELQSNCNH